MGINFLNKVELKDNFDNIGDLWIKELRISRKLLEIELNRVHF